MSNPKSWATRPGCRGASARLAGAAVVVAAAALVSASSALAHARVSPAVSLAKELQLYSLAVPDREGEPDDEADRADGPEWIRDRLVRRGAGLDSGRCSRTGPERTRSFRR